MGTETFVDLIDFFSNRSVHAYVGKAVKARQQWMSLTDMRQQAGWTTATDRKIRQWLVVLDRMRKRMTHTGGGNDQKIDDLEALAAAAQLDLPAVTDDAGLADAIARPSGRAFGLRHKFDGSDPNVPSLSRMSMRNADGFVLLTALDLHITTATRLDSRMATHRITPEESAILFAGLREMWAVCDEFGGDSRAVGITEGVLPTEEPQGPERSAAIIETSPPPTRP